MKLIETELCAFSVEAVDTAVMAGVTRVELCSGPMEDGLAPTAASISMARDICGIVYPGETGGGNSMGGRNSVELTVMIRPRGGNFVYSQREFETMQRGVEFARARGAEGVALGILTPDGEVDLPRVKHLADIAWPLEVTFHRAFDKTADPLRALEDVIAAGCKRILTSGHADTAMEGIETIRELVKRADGRIEIMAGGGVNPDNARELIDAGVDALHFSARVTGADPHNPMPDTDFVRRMVKIAHSA